MKHSLKAGFGRVDITPDLGVRLGGYGVKERSAEEILDRLHSTAMVLEQDGVMVAVINLDWICIEEDVVARLRRDINHCTGIREMNITISTTHSHSVPNTLNMFGWGQAEVGYIESALPSIVRSVEMAKETLRNVTVGFAVTSSLAGVNRRGVAENNSFDFRQDPDGPFDPTMTVIHVKDQAGDAGMIVHYGAHGTAMGGSRVVSRDWCGIMKDRIESQFPVPVLFLNGAIGDVGPRMNLRRGNFLYSGSGDGVHAIREVGYRAATDAIRALLSIREWRDDLTLRVLTEDIVLPYAPLTPLAVAQQELAKWEPRKNEWGAPMCEYGHNHAVVEAYKKPVLTGRTFTQTITCLGPMAIVPMPGEMFSGISLRVRQGSPFQYTLCCSVTNGSLCYFPTREARHRGGYECWVGRATGAYLFADTIDDALVNQNVTLLRKMVET